MCQAQHSGFFFRFVIAILQLVLLYPVMAQLPPADFYHLKRDEDLFSGSFLGLSEDPYGFIWFGSNGGGGLYRYDGYELRAFLTDPTQMESTIASSRIISINSRLDSLIFVGSSFGFSLLHPFSGAIRNFNNNLERVEDVRVGSTWAFLQDTIRDVFWIGTRYSLARFDPALDGLFTNLRPAKPVEGQYMPEDLTQIIMDDSDTTLLWLSTYNGLFSYSITHRTYRYHACMDVADQKMSITDMYQDPSGHLWMATREGNVLQFHKATQRWKVYTIPAANSLSDTRMDVYALLPVDNETIWVSTFTSVGQLNTRTGGFEYWQYARDQPNGLLQNGGYLDLLADRHGRMWIGSWHGVHFAKQAFVPPSSLVKDIRVAITDIELIPSYEDDGTALIYTGKKNLRKDQREITFRFVLPNPLDRSGVSYQYKLDGYDDDWITTDQRRVRYSKLKGGRYTFLVRAKEGVNGIWLAPTSLSITIPKRTAEFWWFWAGFLLFLTGIAVVLYRFLISRARKEERLKAEFENKLSEIQMQALRAQMNPHFLFNSLNSIKYYAISKSKDETATYVSKFAMLVRTILNNSKSHTISLKDELEALQLYIEIEHMRLEGKFDYLVDIDSSIHIRQAQIPPMILQPYVENAIWHGLMHKDGTGRLLVQVKDMGSQIQCIIEDNGIGRVRSAENRKKKMDHKNSVGMQITGNRIELINRIYGIDTQVHVIDLADAEGTPLGTRVVINIPLIRDEEE